VEVVVYGFDAPVGYKVTSVANKIYIDGHVADAYAQVFKSREEAIARKLELQSIGYVACVTAVFLTKPTVKKKLRKQQKVLHVR
jgi:hypothetical protein